VQGEQAVWAVIAMVPAELHWPGEQAAMAAAESITGSLCAALLSP
jgi:hypothetical protein